MEFGVRRERRVPEAGELTDDWTEIRGSGFSVSRSGVRFRSDWKWRAVPWDQVARFRVPMIPKRPLSVVTRAGEEFILSLSERRALGDALNRLLAEVQRPDLPPPEWIGRPEITEKAALLGACIAIPLAFLVAALANALTHSGAAVFIGFTATVLAVGAAMMRFGPRKAPGS